MKFRNKCARTRTLYRTFIGKRNSRKPFGTFNKDIDLNKQFYIKTTYTASSKKSNQKL